MSTASGYIYLAADPDGSTIASVTLNQDTRERRALLAAALTQRGYVPLTVGASVVFKLTPAYSDLVKSDCQWRHGIGAAFNAIGSALGGVAYRLSFSGYQEQSTVDGGTMSERFAFTVDSVPVERGDVGWDECG